MSLVDCILTLTRAKWTPKLWDKSLDKALKSESTVPTTDGSGRAQMFYLRDSNKSQNVWYLRALIKELRREHTVPIPHCAKQDVYREICGVQARKKCKKNHLKKSKSSKGKKQSRLLKHISKGLCKKVRASGKVDASKLADRKQAPSDQNFVWRGHSFTFVRPNPKRKNSLVVWAVTCPLSSCDRSSKLKSGTGCKRQRGFECSDPVAQGRVLLNLKCWLLAAKCKECKSRMDYQRWEPSHEQLDELHMQEAEQDPSVELHLAQSQPATPAPRKSRGRGRGRGRAQASALKSAGDSSSGA